MLRVGDAHQREKGEERLREGTADLHPDRHARGWNGNKSVEGEVEGWGRHTWCTGVEGRGKQKVNFKWNQMSGSGGVEHNSFTKFLD